MREYCRSPRTADLWALSVAALPGAAESEILHRAGHLRQSHYRVASVGDLRRISGDSDADLSDVVLSVVWEHGAHGLVVTMDPPPWEVATQIAAAFGPPKSNPRHQPPPSSGTRRTAAPAAAVYVDVNSIREASQVGTTVSAAVPGYDASLLTIGQQVWAVDADDNAGVAVVTERHGDWLRLRIDESTWAPLAVLSSASRGKGEARRRVVRRAVPATRRDRRAQRRSLGLRPALTRQRP